MRFDQWDSVALLGEHRDTGVVYRIQRVLG